MPLEVSIPPTAKMALLVEDGLTRDYLKTLWGAGVEVDIAFVLGSGNEGVEAIVKSFQEEGFANVFGVTDRDYRPSNRDRWEDPNKTFRTFVLPVHEIENYLLDAQALQAYEFQNRNLTVEAIEARMLEKARRLRWWAACRETIAVLKRRFRQDFINDPKQTIEDESAAWSHIHDSPWFKKLSAEAARSTEQDVHDLLMDKHREAEGRLISGEWRRDFSGKEIYKDVAGWICDETKLELATPPNSRLEFFNSVARGIAAWQVANGEIPPDLSALLAALRGRVAP